MSHMTALCFDATKLLLSCKLRLPFLFNVQVIFMGVALANVVIHMLILHTLRFCLRDDYHQNYPKFVVFHSVIGFYLSTQPILPIFVRNTLGAFWNYDENFPLYMTNFPLIHDEFAPYSWRISPLGRFSRTSVILAYYRYTFPKIPSIV
jgi:hypothetical protein